MRKSIRYILGFVLGLVLMPAGLYGLAFCVQAAAPEAGRWTAEILARKSAAAAEGPKLLIVGGSNALFGYSAERIERRLAFRGQSRVPCRARLDIYPGFRAPFVKPGTLVVLSIEYSLYQKPRRSQTEFLHLLGYDFAVFPPDVADRADRRADGNGMAGLGRMLKARLLGDARRGNSYQSKTLNDHGDETGNRVEDRNPYVVARLDGIPSGGNLTFSPEAIDVITAFAAFSRQHGAKVVVTFPNVLKSSVNFEANKPLFADLGRKLAVHDIPLIGTAEASGFDLAYVFDTIAHQTRDGQALSTDRLIADLRQAGFL